MLTDIAVRRLKPRTKPFKMADMLGLYILVQPSGARYWRMDYRHGGKRGTLALGVYPQIGLKEARKKHAKARELLERGLNPSSYQKQIRGIANAYGGDSFNEVADEWLRRVEAEGRSEATLQKLRWLLSFARPIIGERPIADVETPELLAVLRTVEIRGRYETARRLRSTCGSVIRFAVATGRAQRDIALDLKGALITPKVQHCAAIIQPAKVGQLLRALEGYDGQPTVSIALQMAPHVFVRPGELRGAQWAEFDFDSRIWLIPGLRMKMGRPHKVPLTNQVLKLIDRLRPLSGNSVHLFPNLRSAQRPMSENTLNAALRRLGYDKTEMTACGFRAVASSLLNESGEWHPDAIERQLAHVEGNDVRRAYLRGEHWDERVRMMQYWSDYLDRLAKADRQ